MSPRGGEAAGFESLGVVLSSDCRALRRSLRPLVWVTLEEVALEAVVEDGRAVARTSARQIAHSLALDPGTASKALRELRRRGLLALERENGPAGRFGLSFYEVGPIAGLSVVQPRTAQPLVVSPYAVQSAMAEPVMASPCVDAPHGESAALEASDCGRRDRLAPPGDGPAISPPVAAASEGSGVTGGESAAPIPSRSSARGGESGRSGQCPGQETLDPGWASS